MVIGRDPKVCSMCGALYDGGCVREIWCPYCEGTAEGLKEREKLIDKIVEAYDSTNEEFKKILRHELKYRDLYELRNEK
jgi:hypothetical protein